MATLDEKQAIFDVIQKFRNRSIFLGEFLDTLEDRNRTGETVCIFVQAPYADYPAEFERIAQITVMELTGKNPRQNPVLLKAVKTEIISFLPELLEELKKAYFHSGRKK